MNEGIKDRCSLYDLMFLLTNKKETLVDFNDIRYIGFEVIKENVNNSKALLKRF